jgi:hypothetical protein
MALACAPVQCVAKRVQDEVTTLRSPAGGPPLSCDDAALPHPAVEGCLSGRIHCGDTLTGTTTGGDSVLDDPMYASAFCYPAGDHHRGPERVYLLEAPANTDIEIAFESPCVDLDLAAIAWNYDGRCPTENHRIPECEGAAAPGGGTVRLNTFHARDYLLSVDGKEGVTGAFRLTVRCTPLVR